MADVEISYNNSTIATMNDSGTEVLETNGKVCADDITIAYTKSGGGGIVTAPVSYLYNDAEAIYYTDATMMPVAVTTGSMDLDNVQLPVGSLFVYARLGIAPPMPMPATISGLELMGTHSISRGAIRIYKVVASS